MPAPQLNRTGSHRFAPENEKGFAQGENSANN